MSRVPRNPEHYYPTLHAQQMRRDRDIEWTDVSKTIKTGEVKPTHKDNTYLFVNDCGHDLPIGVVANSNTGEIVTVEFRK